MSENEEKEKIEIPEIDDEQKSFAYYVTEYKGAIIGVVVALLFLVTGLSKLVISLLIIFAGAFVGNYIQKNKSNVKQSLKEFIDKF